MKLSDLERIKELSEEFTDALKAMRALNEHGGPFTFSFGASNLIPDIDQHSTRMDAHDPEYNQVVALMRLALRSKVAALVRQLNDLGVKVDA